MRPWKIVWPLIVWGVAILILLSVATSDSKAHWQPGTHNAIHAINLAFCGKSNKTCQDGNEAVVVAKCESAQYWSQGRPQEAKNGQYLGMFQMGKDERRDYGHGPDPWKQAWAARRYFVASGKDWSPWECQP